MLMRTKNFLISLCVIVTISLGFIIFGQHKPETIQNIVMSTNEQIKSFKDNLRDVESKTLVADEKFLDILGFTQNPRIYPRDVWTNTSLPVVVTYVFRGQESQAIGLIYNVAKILPSNTILVYNLGLTDYGLKTLFNYCNSTRCQVTTLDLYEFPSHVFSEDPHAYRPLVIQDALSRTGATLFIENSYRFLHNVSRTVLNNLYERRALKEGILAFPHKTKRPVTSFTHKKMFEYFRTDAENFWFLQMVKAEVLFVVNFKEIHESVMLPWIQCSLTQDCIFPIGAQSTGCKFDKKPLYRYSGCHSYDASALNIVLGLHYKYAGSAYMVTDQAVYFREVPLHKADAMLKELEQNATIDGQLQLDS
ncbi:uncharacterized protein LOC132703842 [Cylas formicarius]|uniref:uncharacterized protein LOC132703842 n=1 Tax=Cylas formicarius TaxID=197179 RepID=UPI002958D972|nr:uncharacterized protein LOC132703842 [Cylas formicarius]